MVAGKAKKPNNTRERERERQGQRSDGGKSEQIETTETRDATGKKKKQATRNGFGPVF